MHAIYKTLHASSCSTIVRMPSNMRNYTSTSLSCSTSMKRSLDPSQEAPRPLNPKINPKNPTAELLVQRETLAGPVAGGALSPNPKLTLMP